MSSSLGKVKVPKLPYGFNKKLGNLFVKRDVFKPKKLDRGLYHGAQKTFGNSISFSEKKTRRSWNPNIQWVKLYSEALDVRLKVKATQKALRSIDKAGGLDNYLTRTKNKTLGSSFALYLKKIIIDAKKENKQKQEYRNEIEWHAQELLKQASEDPVIEELLRTTPVVTPTTNERQLYKDLYGVLLEKRAEQNEKRKEMEKLIRGTVKRKYRYLAKERREIPEFRLSDAERERLSKLDLERLDAIFRGEVTPKSKKPLVRQTTQAEELEKPEEVESSKTILGAINAAASGDYSNKLLASIMGTQEDKKSKGTGSNKKKERERRLAKKKK